MARANVMVQRVSGSTLTFTAAADLLANTPFYVNGHHGYVMDDVSAGEQATLDMSCTVWQQNLGALSGAVGQIIYIGANSVLSTSATNTRPFAIVQKAKDSNNIADITILGQNITVPTSGA